jgi:low temperature requirement protein LtrA
MSAVPSTFVRRLTPRDPYEDHRASSPLELLTDLCFVVAISQSAALFHHEVSHGSPGHGLVSFLLSFFGIFWAWVNFTWFGSAYDNDDVVYRLITILQIFGSLVYAAGIAGMFGGVFTLGVVGYVIMRVALVFQWLRAARSDPDRRSTCLRYAWGITLVQLLWLGYLLVPFELRIPIFLVLICCELLVPLIAERPNQTPWHPHHIAERYGLFFIIVLGETILSATVAIQQSLGGEHPSLDVGYVVVGGILIVFSVWWIYFARDTGDILARIHGRDTKGEYIFGFGHYAIFASGAAIGAGLAVRVDYWTHEGHASSFLSAAMVTVPTAALLAAIWSLLLRQDTGRFRTAVPFGLAVLLILASTMTPVPELLTGVVCVALLAVEVRAAGLDGRPAHQPAIG